MAIAGMVFSFFGVLALALDSWQLVISSSWIYLWFGYFSWLLFWNPGVILDDAGVTLDNIFRKTSISWSSIKRIDTKYTLSLETSSGTFRAWGAPAPSRYSGLLASKTEAENLPESSYIGKGLIRPGDLTSSDSGVAAYLIRQQWEHLRDRGLLQGAEVVRTQLVAVRVTLFVALSIAVVTSFIF